MITTAAVLAWAVAPSPATEYAINAMLQVDNPAEWWPPAEWVCDWDRETPLEPEDPPTEWWE